MGGVDRPARSTGRPTVIEVAGIAGAGKSTLAANLAARLSELGLSASDSRSTRRQRFSASERVVAFLNAFPEAAAAFVFVAGRIARGHLPFSAVSRFGPAFQHSRQLQLLVRRLGGSGIVVQEPGWLMDLLTQYVHTHRSLDPATAISYISRGPRIDFAIILRASPATARRHMNSRKRGLPRSFRKLDEAELHAVLRWGDECAATLVGACHDAGIATLEVGVDDLDADGVALRCMAFLDPYLTQRGQEAASKAKAPGS